MDNFCSFVNDFCRAGEAYRSARSASPFGSVRRMACLSTLSNPSASSVFIARLSTSRTVPKRTAISSKVVHSRRGTTSWPFCSAA